MTAKECKRQFHGDVEFEPTRSGRLHSLDNYMKLIGYELPNSNYGVSRTGENLRVVRDALDLHGTWDALTERQRARWVEVIHHNMHDCLALRDVGQIVATQFDSTGAPE